eukprot:scaffold105407_cov49-Tisochrysis_lutea.AAC.1
MPGTMRLPTLGGHPARQTPQGGHLHSRPRVPLPPQVRRRPHKALQPQPHHTICADFRLLPWLPR